MVATVKRRCPRWCVLRRLGHSVGEDQHRSRDRWLWHDTGRGCLAVRLHRPCRAHCGTSLSVFVVRGDVDMAEADITPRFWARFVVVTAWAVWRR